MTTLTPEERDFYRNGCGVIFRNEIKRLVDALEDMERQRDSLLAALTPSSLTKAAYMSEVKDGRSYVSWEAIKEIMEMILKNAQE